MSDNGSDDDNKKGGTTSFNDNISSDNESDTSDNDDLEMTVNIDKAILDKEFQKISEKMEQEKMKPSV